MNKLPARKHGWLYYRNSMIAWGSFLFLFGASMFSPSTWVSVLWLVPLALVIYVLWANYLAIHPFRRRFPQFTPADFQMEYEPVSFPSRDGLTISAWYVKGRNRATIILVHGAGGGKVTLLKHAQFLALEGYGILMLDLRAHGDSQGDTVTGVLEANDVLGAVDFLSAQPDADPARIGALGISLGAWTVLQAAARSETIRAVVLESLGTATLADHGGKPKTLRRWLNYPLNWFFYTVGDLLANIKPPGVLETLPKLAPRPVFLIAAGRGKEIYFNRLFLAAASEPKSLWEVTRADHATAYIFEPVAYREKVRQFFKKSLDPQDLTVT